MPVRQATSAAVREIAEEPAAEKLKKPKGKGSREKSVVPEMSISNGPDLPTLVQALLEFPDPNGLPLQTPPPPSTPGSRSTDSRPETLAPRLNASLARAPSPDQPSSPNTTSSTHLSAPVSIESSAISVAREDETGSAGKSAAEVDYHHDSEAEFSRLLDYYGIEWQYEPHQFPLEWRDGRPIVMFTPDFYLPEYDLYIELTTMRQSLVRRKNRKLRLLRALYPEINIKLLYRRDYHRLLQRFGIKPEELDAEATNKGEVSGT